MTGFILKLVAVISMVLDHVKYAIPQTQNFITQYLGRLAFPIFAFLVAEGMVHTKSRKKYLIRMIIFAAISQIPYMLFRTLISDRFVLNIMVTFSIAIIGIMIFEFIEKLEYLPKFLRFIMTMTLSIAILLIAYILPIDYGWYGISTVWLFYILREQKIARTIGYIFLVLLYYLSRYIGYFDQINWISYAFASLPAIIVLFYNGKEGRKLKYWFYAFYPVHLALLYALSFVF